KSYPKPDWQTFFKATGGLIAFLVVLHWIPEVAIWMHAHFFGDRIVVNERSYHAILVVAYAMCGIAWTIHLSGCAWGWWHNRRPSHEI
ncbi:MAG: hypothetical protein ACMG50_08380, partial [Thermomonas sp.]